MTSNATTPEQYLAELPEDRKSPVLKLHETIMQNKPEGFEGTMGYGMLCYVVPHSLYPAGYHCAPELPLPFMSVASQKNFIAFYHMGIYAMPELYTWFTEAYSKFSKAKLDMGKSCIRFKKPEQIPFELIAELVQKVSVNDWITTYETKFRR